MQKYDIDMIDTKQKLQREKIVKYLKKTCFPAIFIGLFWEFATVGANLDKQVCDSQSARGTFYTLDGLSRVHLKCTMYHW
jgi:hypothetical protein